jgi:hypothetical protein
MELRLVQATLTISYSGGTHFEFRLTHQLQVYFHSLEMNAGTGSFSKPRLCPPQTFPFHSIWSPSAVETWYRYLVQGDIRLLHDTVSTAEIMSCQMIGSSYTRKRQRPALKRTHFPMFAYKNYEEYLLSPQAPPWRVEGLLYFTLFDSLREIRIGCPRMRVTSSIHIR